MKKVLVLEDEANIRSFVVINLKRAGYEAIEAETGEEALAQLKRNPDIKVALLGWTLCCLIWMALRYAAVSGRGTITSASLCSPPALRRWIRSPG